MSVKTYIEGYDWLGIKQDDFYVKQAAEAGRPVEIRSRTRWKRPEEGSRKLDKVSSYTAFYAPSVESAPSSVVFAHTRDADGVRVIRGFFRHVDEADDFLVENKHFGCEESGVAQAPLPYLPTDEITIRTPVKPD